MKKILLLAFGLGVAIWLNYQKSVDRALQKACDGGTVEACLDLGNRYRDRYRDGEGIPQDFARVASLYEQACKGGEMLACNNLGEVPPWGGSYPGHGPSCQPLPTSLRRRSNAGMHQFGEQIPVRWDAKPCPRSRISRASMQRRSNAWLY